MTTGYNSQYRGSVVDAAVATVLANKSKGSTSTPVYLDANGTAIPITSYAGTADKAIKDESGNVIEDTYATKSELEAKQGTLVSGINIKTINRQDIMGAGNMSTFPSQTGQAGKFLGTNGTDVSWETVDLTSKQDVITGAATTIASTNLTENRAVISNASGKVSVSDVTSTELAVLDGITSTTSELNVLHGLTATTAELNKVHGLTATTEELNYCSGVTSAIQTQLNGKVSSTEPVVAAPYLKTCYVNGTAGYNIWSNGYCEQWGQITTTGYGYTSTVSLTKTFANTDYQVLLSWTYETTQGDHGSTAAYRVGGKAVSSFQIYSCFENYQPVVTWRLFGYLAEGQY